MFRRPIFASGVNIYGLELVVIYLGGSVGLLLLGPGRISFDAGLAHGLLDETADAEDASVEVPLEGRLNPIPVEVSSR